MRFPLLGIIALSATALLAQAPPKFEVATVRPTAGPIPGVPPIFGQQRSSTDTLTIRHTQLVEIIRRAFGVVDQELVGVPDSLKDQRFDIIGKAAVPTPDPQLWVMVRPLLEERFKLKYHRERREVSGLALVVAKKGTKLVKSEGGSNEISLAGGILTGHNVTLIRLAQLLSSVMRKPVSDMTGLEGSYDFTVDPKPYAGPGQDLPGMVISAIQEELGLKLESKKIELQVMVIDSIQAPDEN
jgi:uncharacterized protein (TIGR03435 family)